MTILPRLIAIAMKKYVQHPDDRAPAVKMLARNALRLAIAHLGITAAEELAHETLREPLR